MRLAEHVKYIRKRTNENVIFIRIAEGKQWLQKFRHKYKDNIKMDLKEMWHR